MELCRLCYTELSPHSFRKIFNTENEPPFLDIIKKLTDIDISESDPYPKIMCINCYDKLANVYDFFKTIKETDSKFRRNSRTNEPKEKNVVQLKIKQEMDCDTDEHAEIDSSILNEPKLVDNKSEIDIDDCFAATIKEEVDGHINSDNEEEENCETVEMDENTVSSNDETSRESTITLEKDSKIENVNCKICGNTFKHKNDLTKHLRTHDKVYICYICKEIFPDLADLEEHKRLHTTNKPHKCNICKKTFLLKKYLLKHLTVHLDEQPSKCDICEREFSRKGTFRKHMKMHEENRIYECDVCDKVFTQYLDLRNHKFEHLDKVYECKVCGKKFMDRAYSLKHLKAVHFGEKKHQCDICGEQFTLKSLLNKHFRLHKDKVETTRKEMANLQSENGEK